MSWFWCYYQNRLRDSVFPVSVIYFRRGGGAKKKLGMWLKNANNFVWPPSKEYFWTSQFFFVCVLQFNKNYLKGDQKIFGVFRGVFRRQVNMLVYLIRRIHEQLAAERTRSCWVSWVTRGYGFTKKCNYQHIKQSLCLLRLVVLSAVAVCPNPT